jgi:hypothetical protein
MFATIGYFPLLELNKFLIKNEIKELLMSNPNRLSVVKIVNPEKDPSFQRIHKGEFRYKGKMYDIAVESTDGHTTTFLCIHDKKEENLFKGLKQDSENKFTSLWWDHQIKIAYPVFLIQKNEPINITFKYPLLSKFYESQDIPVKRPPPKG